MCYRSKIHMEFYNSFLLHYHRNRRTEMTGEYILRRSNSVIFTFSKGRRVDPILEMLQRQEQNTGNHKILPVL